MVKKPSKSTKKRKPKAGGGASEMSGEVSRLRSNLLAVVSHELNTPITGIVNATEMISLGKEGNAEALAMLRRNTERLQRTVRNLMEIARVDAGTLRVRLSELDLGNFLNQRVEALSDRLDAFGFAVKLSIEEDLPHACGDLVRLSHVVDSLVLNAVKFSDKTKLRSGEAAEITVQVSLESAAKLPKDFQASGWLKKTGLYFFVSIQSSLPNIGESPKHFEELFEPFTPWRDADVRVQEGLGVELALAKEILIAHEGFIWADFEGRRGWTFHIALPMLSRSDELDMVLSNRLFTAIGALSRVSLLIIRPEPGALSGARGVVDVVKTVQRLLFRSSDSIFWVEEAGELTVLMDDCDEANAKRVGQRIVAALIEAVPDMPFMWTSVTGPDEGSSAEELLIKARDRWQPGRA